MAANLGAHEVMELHEVLSDTINGINQFELYRPHINDQQLGAMVDKQIQFMTQEYNSMVEALNSNGVTMESPYPSPQMTQPKYGLNNPEPQSPNTSPQQLSDRDIASGMLGCHKSSTVFKALAALECADPNLRRMVQQGSNNCSEMAYEVWQYMNQKGYYQVPTMKQMTTNTMTQSYNTAGMSNLRPQSRMMMQSSEYNPQIRM